MWDPQVNNRTPLNTKEGLIQTPLQLQVDQPCKCNHVCRFAKYHDHKLILATTAFGTLVDSSAWGPNLRRL